MNSEVSWNIVCPCQREGQRVWGHPLLCQCPHPHHRETDSPWVTPCRPPSPTHIPIDRKLLRTVRTRSNSL